MEKCVGLKDKSLLTKRPRLPLSASISENVKYTWCMSIAFHY